MRSGNFGESFEALVSNGICPIIPYGIKPPANDPSTPSKVKNSDLSRERKTPLLVAGI